MQFFHMTHQILTATSLLHDLRTLGVEPGDGLFVHASMRSIGSVIGGPRSVTEALLKSVGHDGLIGMPAFSTDAYFPSQFDTTDLSDEEVAQIERAVPGFDPARSPTSGMGVIAETFRTWPGTRRSRHPAVSVSLNGKDADAFTQTHALAWATGPDTPLGQLLHRDRMKLLLVGVGWNKCSALHTAETLAGHRRTKVRRFKSGSEDATWSETPDVADDLGRLFPSVGAAFEASGQVGTGSLGQAECKICDYRALVTFASDWINAANRASGDGPDDPPPTSVNPAIQPAQTEPETAPMPHATRRSRNAEVNFKGEKRSNATHASVTDPDARLYKKSAGTGAVLCFMGHALMENRHGLVVQGDLTRADGRAERKAALDMLHRHSPGSTRQLTLGADRGYDAAEFVADLRQACVTPHVARKARHSAIDGRTNPAQRLCPVPEAPQADRRSLRLGQNRWRHVPDRLSRRRTGAVALHPDARRWKSRPAAPVADGMRQDNAATGLLPALYSRRAMRELIPPGRTASRWAD